MTSLEDLMAVAHGYQGSMALFVALRLDVFSVLGAGPADATGLARRLGADSRNLSILLDALSAAGLLHKERGKYRSTGISREFLGRGPRSKRSIILHHLDCWPDWTGLEKKVRGGRKARGRPADYHENFIRGMEDNARDRAVAVARAIPLREGDRVLDLGAGACTYAAEWAGRHPGATVTAFDTAATLRVARSILREKEMTGRVRLLEGDFLDDPLGGPYDFVWISQILHAFPERECVAILRKARKALAPRGRIAVQEFVLRDDKTGPPGPAFFSVHMVAVTDGGRAYSGAEIAGMLRTAGFSRVKRHAPDARGVGIVTANKS